MGTPFVFIDPENFIPANPIVTPIHIQPEWYFLFAYSILRAIPRKLGVVILLVLSIFIILLLPILHESKVKVIKFRIKKFVLFFHFGSFSVLTWLGIQPVEAPLKFQFWSF